MKKSSVLHNKRVARQRNRRLKRRQRSLRQWLARLAKVRHSLASLTAAREPAAAGARGFYKGGPPPRRRSPRVEQLPWSGNVEYRASPQDFGGQPLRKQRPLAITEAPSRLPLTPSSLVERVIVCSEADFLGDHRRLCPLSSPVSVGWGPLPEAGALRVITPAPVPDRLFSAQFQLRARGQEGLGSFAPEGLPERPWPLETHTQTPLKSRCSWGVPSASWAGGYQGKLPVVALRGAARSAVNDSPPGTEQPASSDENRRINRRVYVAGDQLRENTRSSRATPRLRKIRSIEKSYRLCKKPSSRKGLSGAKHQRDCLGKPKAATPRARGGSRAAAGASLRKRGLLQTVLKEARTPSRDGGSSDHFTLLPLSALPRRKKPSIAVDNEVFVAEVHLRCRRVFLADHWLRENTMSSKATTASTQYLTGRSYPEPAEPEEISPEVLAEFHRVREEDAAYLAVVRIIICFGECDSHAGLPSGASCSDCRVSCFPPILIDDSW